MIYRFVFSIFARNIAEKAMIYIVLSEAKAPDNLIALKTLMICT